MEIEIYIEVENRLFRSEQRQRKKRDLRIEFWVNSLLSDREEEEKIVKKLRSGL